jgi:hypothetical protein
MQMFLNLLNPTIFYKVAVALKLRTLYCQYAFVRYYILFSIIF